MSGDGWKFAESLLGVAAEALKARREAEEKGATSIPPSLLSESERRFRAEVAERLWWALGPGGGQATKHDLDAMLKEVVRANEDALKWRNRAVTDAKVRDAALEEAAELFEGFARDAMEQAPTETRHLARDKMQAHARSIRALKSKPATETYAPCLSSEFGKGSCLAPAGHSGEHRFQETVLAPQPSGNSGELDAEQVRELKEFRESRTAERKVDPNVHDFGWALARMREGKRVRRADWVAPRFIRWRDDCVQDVEGAGSSTFRPWTADWGATDWQVVE